MTRELRDLGFEATALGDAIWPDSTRSLKGRTKSPFPLESSIAREPSVAEDADNTASDCEVTETVSLDRRAALVASLASPAKEKNIAKPRSLPKAQTPSAAPKGLRLVVTDEAKTRGLHLDGVSTVFVLGGAANGDAYLHLAGRTARWPSREGTVVTIAPNRELRRVKGWAADLSVKLTPLDLRPKPDVVTSKQTPEDTVGAAVPQE